MSSGWKQGPLPPNTYNWGGVVPKGHTGGGFYFADFCGDHVKVIDGTDPPRVLKPDEVAWYNNDIYPAPVSGVAGRGRIGG